MRTALVALVLVGCFPEPKDPTGALIDKCAAEARAAHYVGGASAGDAMAVYDACIAEGAADGVTRVHR